MWLHVLLVIMGFALLYYGAEWLVKGSANLARALGVSPVVIGLTVVAFGTSAPELVVSVVSSFGGKSMIAVGNAVGSNIANIALVLGSAACLMPIIADRSVVRRDIPLMLGISIFLFILSMDSSISRIEGMTLFGGVILYTIFNYYISAREKKTACHRAGSAAVPDMAPLPTELPGQSLQEIEEIGIIASRPKQIFLILAGITGVITGAQVLIDSAVVIMKTFGLSEKFIGLTIVAIGTSLPELATSITAAFRKQMDISIGNLIGSNVFNILSVIGLAGIVRPIDIPGGFFASGLVYDYLVMMSVSFLPWVLMRRDCTIRRSGGVLLLGCYLAYMTWLVYMG
ncbi:MAG: calcium/sodium antiporter [Desulfotignum sp.]